MHGHGYRVGGYLTGEAYPNNSWIIDLTKLKEIFTSIHDALDHKVLNKVEELETTTVENLTVWIWKKLFFVLLVLSKVTVYETQTSESTYTGN